MKVAEQVPIEHRVPFARCNWSGADLRARWRIRVRQVWRVQSLQPLAAFCGL